MASGNLKSALSLAILFGACLCAICREDPQTRARLWMLREGEIMEYNPSSWLPVATIQVPKEFFRDPDRLQITHTGEMLFCMDPDIEFGNPVQHFDRNKMWVWNGRSASVLNLRPGAGSGSASGTEKHSRLSLSADGKRLFWFENEFRENRSREGIAISVTTTSSVWHTDLSGANPEPIARFSFPQCTCATGACSETCPEAGFWFPRTGIDDFFFINHWIPGQLGYTFQSSFLYQRSGGKWISARLAGAIEDILDAAQTGRIAVHAVRDGGCCGWDNEGNDQTLVATGGKTLRIFDERQKYGNPNYDVSFYTENAALSPNLSAVAMTIVSTSAPGAEIRLSDAGKKSPAELARIRKSLEALPLTEVISLANPSRPLVELSHTTFAGWLSDREILILENGVLAGFDTAAKTRRTSPLKASGASGIFVR